MRWKVPALLMPMIAVLSLAALGDDLDRARSLAEAGRRADALADIDEYLARNPVDPEAMFLRGLVLAEVEREGEARQAFEQLRSLRPDRPEPLNNLAVIQAAMGDYDGAIETLKEALRTHPAYRTVYENLTKIYGQLASEAYSRALSVEGSHTRSSVELVLLSEMTISDSEPVRVAQAQSGSAAAGSTAPGSQESTSIAASEAVEPPVDSDGAEAAGPVAPLPLRESVEVAETTRTPDQAIEEALRQGRSAQGAPLEPTSELEDESAAGRAEVTSEPEAEEQVPNAADLAAVVEAWARAWAEQRVDDYLSFYSGEFVPANGSSPPEWREVRRQRVAAPEFVKVSVAFLDFDTTDPDRALVRFNQSYESDTFSDIVTKTLELVREDGAWKIVKESVDS